MTETEPLPPITGTVTVAIPVERAFDLFAGDFTAWWPPQYHIGQSDISEVILEPRAGGRWYERGVDGSECDWGRVLVWNPPHRLVFTWQINGAWQFDPDPEHASEIEVLFTEDEPGHATVAVEHRHFDRLIDGANVFHAIRDGGGGWVALLQSYAKNAANTH